jgi:curved DNA-binding protein CbpA
MDDYYKILGISPDADEKEIRTAYRRMARKYHPDAGEGSSAEAFRDVQDAYELLSDSVRRREYDRSRESRSKIQFTAREHTPAYPSHIDLREIVNSRRRADPGPVEFRSRARDVDDEWRQLLEFLFRDF